MDRYDPYTDKFIKAQPHAYRGVTLNDVMMYFDSLEGNENAWTEFCSCLECRGWGLYHIRSATDKNVGTTDTISRQAAIDYFVLNVGFHDEDGYPIEDTDELRKIWTEYFDGIPSAQPKRGKWIKKHRHYGGFRSYTGFDAMGEQHTVTVDERTEYDDLYCSECGARSADNFLNFCPNCGAKMEGDAE